MTIRQSLQPQGSKEEKEGIAIRTQRQHPSDSFMPYFPTSPPSSTNLLKLGNFHLYPFCLNFNVYSALPALNERFSPHHTSYFKPRLTLAALISHNAPFHSPRIALSLPLHFWYLGKKCVRRGQTVGGFREGTALPSCVGGYLQRQPRTWLWPQYLFDIVTTR